MIILGYHFRNSHIYLFCLEDYPWYLHTVCHHYRNNISVLSLIYKCLMSCQLECFPTGIMTLFFMDEMWSTTMWRSVGGGGGVAVWTPWKNLIMSFPPLKDRPCWLCCVFFCIFHRNGICIYVLLSYWMCSIKNHWEDWMIIRIGQSNIFKLTLFL